MRTPDPTIRNELDRIIAEHGTLTPEIVVQEARKKTSPLHGHFEWRDSVAAHIQRLAQAREIINGVRVVITTDRVAVSTVAYVRDPKCEAQEQGYVAVETLRNDKDAARAVLVYECNRIASSLERGAAIAAAVGLSSLWQRLTSDLGKVRKQLAA